MIDTSDFELKILEPVYDIMSLLTFFTGSLIDGPPRRESCFHASNELAPWLFGVQAIPKKGSYELPQPGKGSA